MSDLGDWFKGIPFFTRWWLALTVGFTLFGRFGIFKSHQLVLLYEPFIKQFQVRFFFLHLIRVTHLEQTKLSSYNRIKKNMKKPLDAKLSAHNSTIVDFSESWEAGRLNRKWCSWKISAPVSFSFCGAVVQKSQSVAYTDNYYVLFCTSYRAHMRLVCKLMKCCFCRFVTPHSRRIVFLSLSPDAAVDLQFLTV